MDESKKLHESQRVTIILIPHYASFQLPHNGRGHRWHYMSTQSQNAAYHWVK